MNRSTLAIPGDNLSVYRLSVSSVSGVIELSSKGGRTENGSRRRKSVVRRRTCARISLITSSLATVSGFLSVLIAIYYCIVPELRADQVVYTDCHLLDDGDHLTIRPLRKFADALIPKPGVHRLLPVLYRVEHGPPQHGWLNISCDRSTKDAIQFEDQLKILIRHGKSLPCFYIKTAKQRSQKPFTTVQHITDPPSTDNVMNIGNSTERHFNKDRQRRHHLWWKLGVILWPTVIFTIGFVGLFFSAIFSAYK